MRRMEKLVNWGTEYIAAAAIILAAVVGCIMAVRRGVSTQPARGLLTAGIVFIALLVWAHLAVGVF